MEEQERAEGFVACSRCEKGIIGCALSDVPLLCEDCATMRGVGVENVLECTVDENALLPSRSEKSSEDELGEVLPRPA